MIESVCMAFQDGQLADSANMAKMLGKSQKCLRVVQTFSKLLDESAAHVEVHVILAQGRIVWGQKPHRPMQLLSLERRGSWETYENVMP